MEEIFRGRGGAHGFKGERRGAKEKFKSHMPYLLLGAEHVSQRRAKTSNWVTCGLNIICEFYIYANPIVDWPRFEIITSRKRKY